MKQSTETVLKALLTADPSTADRVDEVMRLLGSENYIPRFISETKAAKVMGISPATLNLWRRHGRDNQPFPFNILNSIMKGKVLYDEREIIQYIQVKMHGGEAQNNHSFHLISKNAS